MSKFDDLKQKVEHYWWLQRIAGNYESMLKLMDREKDYFTIYGLTYAARGDTRNFQVNPHRTIPYKFIYEGLKAELETINAEIAECEKELKGWL